MGLGAPAPKPILVIHPRSSERGIIAFSRKLLKDQKGGSFYGLEEKGLLWRIVIAPC